MANHQDSITKVCRKCGIEKLLTEFFRDKGLSDGYKWSCKECQKAYQVEFNNRPKIEVQSKFCWICNETKDVQNFYKIKNSPDGFDYYCKPCKKKKYDEYVISEKEVAEEKYCPECKTTKSADLFYKSSHHKYGLSRLCRDCSDISSRNYRNNNPEKCKEISRQYRKNNISRITEYKKSYFHTRRAREIGAEGEFSQLDIDRIYSNQKGKCANCRKRLGDKYHRDHIVPLIKGGSNWPENIQLLCPDCNYRKSGKDPIVWANMNGRLL